MILTGLEVDAGGKGFEFSGGWSFLAMSGSTSDPISCGEGPSEDFRHFEGLSAQSSR